jgi:hypothetical protein
MKTRRNNKKGGKSRKLRKLIGGKTLSSSTPVKLNYNGKDIICEICNSNNYTENTGTISKSKVRQGLGDIFFGEAAQVLDNTSVIIYTCNTCGLCKIIRNKDPILINAQPV